MYLYEWWLNGTCVGKIEEKGGYESVDTHTHAHTYRQKRNEMNALTHNQTSMGLVYVFVTSLFCFFKSIIKYVYDNIFWDKQKKRPQNSAPKDLKRRMKAAKKKKKKNKYRVTLEISVDILISSSCHVCVCSFF